jgi:GTP-binding protein
MITNPYTRVTFLKSAAQLSQLPEDMGYEVAFVGRSNAGKSSALNTLTQNKKMARTSKTPGRTQLINLFTLDESRRLVDLPGYGYAKVSASLVRNWQQLLADYLRVRESLKGLIIIMDCRHPLTPLDVSLIKFAAARSLKLHILLTKADKLSRSQYKATEIKVQKALTEFSMDITVQAFSSLKKEGVETLVHRLNMWFEC